jgi:uncharacterized protein involved in exopolysaccharide biosynthesis
MNDHSAPDSQTAAEPPREVDLVAYALLLIRHLRFILACGLTTAVLMAIFVLLAKPRFSATAVMVLPQNNDKASALQAQLTSATADLLGGGIELYADILQSRSVADALIQQFDLQHEYHTKDLQAAELTLAAMTKVEVQREGLLRVSVQDADPQRAADLANAYVQQLNVLNHTLVLTSAGQRRFYLEEEMTKEKDKLADAEVALKQHQETTSGLPPEAQVSAALSAIEATRVQLRSAQIRLEALQIGETEANPDVVRARREVEGLTAQLEQLERGTTSAETGTPTTQVPAQLLDYTRLLREVKFHESLFELLEKQFEEAKLEESKTPSIVQVLDTAVPAKHKSWPPRTLYTLLAMIVGLFCGVAFVSLRALVMAYIHAPQNAGEVEQIRQLFRRG